MAVSATTHINVRNGGSDTICGGGFDPTQTAGMWTDGAATVANTSAPVFTSASYNFVAGDVGAYLFIGAGTNWTKGWYQIASVAGNAATLTATASGYQPYGDAVNTSAGCASVASPTGATWAVDYSQQDAAEFSGTDGTAAGAGSTLSSVTIGFLRHMVGNVCRITAGTNATTGHHVITSVAAGVATFNNAVTTGVTSDTTIYVGGALASPGYAGAVHIGGCTIWLKYHATAYTATSTSSNVTLGKFTASATGTKMIGYYTVRGDSPRGATRPVYKCGVNYGAAYLFNGASGSSISNIIIDGNRANFTGCNGIQCVTASQNVVDVKIMGCGTPMLVTGTAGNRLISCEITDCTAAIAVGTTSLYMHSTSFHHNTVLPLTVSSGICVAIDCAFWLNTGSGAHISSTAGGLWSGCVFHGNTVEGLYISGGGVHAPILNCIFTSNGATGLRVDAASAETRVYNCAFYNNTTTDYTKGYFSPWNVIGTLTLASSPFVDPANGDFRLNNAAGRSLKTGGYPSTFPGLTWATNAAIGAAGVQVSAGGGGPFQPF